MSCESLPEFGSLNADDDNASQSRQICRNQLVDRHPLEQPTDNPNHRVERAKRGSGRVRVGRLGIVDPQHSPPGCDCVSAMVVESKRNRCAVDGLDGGSERAGERCRGEHIGRHVWRCQSGGGKLGHRHDFKCRTLAIVQERAIAQDVIDHAKIARARNSESEADGAASFHDISVLDHGDSRLVATVEYGRNTRVLIDPCLGSGIGLRRTMPIEMVCCDVEAHARMWGQTVRVIQLEARQFNDKYVPADWVPDGVQHGNADISAGDCPTSVRDEHGCCQLHRGGLAICSGHRKPLGRRADFIPQPPGEFDIAPHRDCLPGGPEDQRMTWCEPRRHHDQIRRERRNILVAAVRQVSCDQPGADHRQERRMLRVAAVGENQHISSELDERVCNREAG